MRSNSSARTETIDRTLKKKDQDTIIVSAVIVGYSRLMRLDAMGTRRAVSLIDEQYFRGRLGTFGGREIRELEGRAVLEFPDAVRALGFAIGLQLAVSAHNGDLREDRRIQFRIGMERASRRDGDEQAETIAHSLMEMAEPGGVCLSDSVRNNIPTGAGLSIEQIDTGIFQMVPESVDAYALVLNEKARAFADGATAHPARGRRVAAVASALAAVVVLGTVALFYVMQERGIPAGSVAETGSFDRPSIVVLPFENLTNSDEGAMIAHGLTASITSALSEVPQLAVISANSASTFAQRYQQPVDAGARLGVGYVLDGSLQLQDDRVRVIAELSDTGSGRSVWSQRYDKQQSDLFAVQDEITLQVLVALQVVLADDTRAQSLSSGTSNVEAYLGLMRAEQAYQRFTKDSMIEARRLLKQVLEIDPNYYQALVLEAKTYTYDAQLGYSDDPAASLQAAQDLLQKAAAINNNASASDNAEVQIAQAYRDQIAGAYESAVSQALAAAETSPNNSEVQALAGWVLSFNRDYERATDLLLNAAALDPAYPSWFANYVSRNATFTERFSDALEWADTGVSRAKNDRQRAWALMSLIFARVENGQLDEARASGAEARRAWPGISLETVKRAQPFQYDADWARFAAAMRTAGLFPDS